mgnify:CR=1 FL=1
MVKVIAECGKNFVHSKDITIPEALQNAKFLALKAKESGADIVKFQTHVFQDEYKKRSPERWEWIKFNQAITPYDEFWKLLKEYCDYIGIEFMTTPMSKMAAEKINDLVKTWKIGSADITDFELLNYVAETKKPLIVSTGMSNSVQIVQALDTLTKYGSKITLLHCVSLYPAPQETLNLMTICYWKEKYTGMPIGFSDHSNSILAPAVAIAMGAEVIEKHFTLNRDSFGFDHKISLEPNKFKMMVSNIRKVEMMLGKKEKILLPKEQELWKQFRI